MQHVYYNLVSGDVSVDCVVGGGVVNLRFRSLQTGIARIHLAAVSKDVCRANGKVGSGTSIAIAFGTKASLSLSSDHEIIDGATGARFGHSLKVLIEDRERLMA
jgi:pyruvate/2-oxoglutarate dehydrogenase complex dihydrolipoamide acyltransferase (E2) component